MTAQRRRFRSCQTALLDRLVQGVDDAEALGYLERWLELAPFERRAHAQMLTLLARGERLREGEEHLAAAVQLFESSGLDAGPLVAAWRNARGAGSASLLAVTEPPSPGADGDARHAGAPRSRSCRSRTSPIRPAAVADRRTHWRTT